MKLARFARALGLACLAYGCGSKKNDGAGQSSTLSAAATSPTGTGGTKPVSKGEAKARVVVDYLALGEECSAGHRGLLLDFGDVTTRSVRLLGSRSRGRKGEAGEGKSATAVEHEGATWLRVTGKGVSLTFPGAPDVAANARLVLAARVRGASARAVTFTLNGKAVGSITLAKGVTKVATIAIASAPLLTHDNLLSVQFHGGQSGSDVAGEIDWVRIGPADDDAPFAAPVRADIVQTLAIGSDRKRALTLRAPGYVRCTAVLPSESRFDGSLALLGDGEADVELRVAGDRGAVLVPKSVHLTSEDSAKFVPLIVELPSSQDVVEVSLVVTHASKGTRVAFGEPRIVAGGAAPIVESMPPAKSVVLVVLSSVSTQSLSVYGGPVEMPELGALASGAMIFENHRATTTLANGAFASMLTGREAQDHGLTDPHNRLPKDVSTLADVLHQAGVQTAMFSANPTTFAPFGFARGWDEFRAEDPADQTISAVRVFEDAAKWLGTHTAGRNFVVVHARAGHPPWDATREELKEMAPANYSGLFDPRRAGEYLARIRKPGAALHFRDVDRTRMWALYGAALHAHDTALGGLLAAIRQQNRDDDTAILVTADLGLDQGAPVPFGEGSNVDEAALSLPLVVRPAGVKNASRTRAATSSADLAPTILRAFGLAQPMGFGGVDLWESATGKGTAQGRLRVAVTGKDYAVQWGDYLYSTSESTPKKLCVLSLEPGCVSDMRAAFPIATRHLAVLTGRELEHVPSFGPEGAAIDYGAATSLKVWGHTGGL